MMIIAALLGLMYAKGEVIRVDIFVAQPQTNLAKRQWPTIFCKEANTALPLLGLGCGNYLFRIDIIVIAIGVDIFRSSLQVAFPKRPRKDELRCP